MPADAASDPTNLAASAGQPEDDDRVADVIPLRKSVGNSGSPQPGNDVDDTVWWYRQKRRGRNSRHYSGFVTYMGGVEGERIRGELAAVIADLLIWAAEHESREDRGAA